MSLKISPQLEEKITEITREFCKKPICEIFLKPVDPEKDYAHNYYNIITNPQNLSEILRRLEGHEYDNYYQWENDMEHVWKNCILYNGIDSIYGQVAESMQILWKKKCLKLKKDGYRGWLDYVNFLFMQLNKLILNCPDAMYECISSRNLGTSLNEKEINYISRSASNLTTKEDIHGLMQLFNIFRIPFLNEKKEVHVDIENIPPEASTIIKKYIKERMDKKDNF